MQITLTQITGYGVKYHFDDGATVALDDNGDVLFINLKGTEEHLKAVQEHEQVTGLAWSSVVTEDHKPEPIEL